MSNAEVRNPVLGAGSENILSRNMKLRGGVTCWVSTSIDLYYVMRLVLHLQSTCLGHP